MTLLGLSFPGSGDQADRRHMRRGALTSLLVAAGGLAAAAIWEWRPRPATGRGYQDVARWRIPGGQGRFIAVGAGPTAEELRALGEQLRRELRDVENAVVMVFDDAVAAREVRRGSRAIGEERFQAGLAHQRAMYVKQAGRREHSLVLYDGYPRIKDVVRYDLTPTGD